MRASAIAEQFDIDKGAISRQVQHLVDLGLVDRVTDPDDGRAMLVSVSDEAPYAGSTDVAAAPPQVARRAARRLVRRRPRPGSSRRSAATTGRSTSDQRA